MGESKPTIDDARALATDVARQFTRRYMDSVAVNWERVDRFSTWVMGAAGAAATLAIGHVELLSQRFGVGGVKFGLWMLALAIFLGVLEKYWALKACIAVEADKLSASLAKEVTDKHDVSIQAVRSALSPEDMQRHFVIPFAAASLAIMLPATPWPIRKLVRYKVLKQLENPEKRQNAMFTTLLWQTLATSLQLIALGIVVIVAALFARP